MDVGITGFSQVNDCYYRDLSGDSQHQAERQKLPLRSMIQSLSVISPAGWEVGQFPSLPKPLFKLKNTIYN